MLGAGLGESCLTKDPMLVSILHECQSTELIKLTRRITKHILGHVIDFLNRTLKDFGLSIKDARVVMLEVVLAPSTGTRCFIHCSPYWTTIRLWKVHPHLLKEEFQTF